MIDARIALRSALLIAVVLCACAAPKRAKSPCPPPPCGPAAESAPCVMTGVAIDDAHALWIRVRTNAERALKVEAGDVNKGWLERAIEADGRALFTHLGHCDFDRFPVQRGTIRARLLIVVKPPSVEDRREAIQSVDLDFGEMMKRRG